MNTARMGEITIHTPDDAEAQWEQLFYAQRPLIEAALAENGGTHTFEDIDRLRKEGKVQYWPGNESAIVTQIVDHPQKRIAHCFLAAGNLDELARMRAWIEEWARRQGCVAASLSGRKGWERHLAGEGYKYYATVLEKSL